MCSFFVVLLVGCWFHEPGFWMVLHLNNFCVSNGVFKDIRLLCKELLQQLRLNQKVMIYLLMIYKYVGWMNSKSKTGTLKIRPLQFCFMEPLHNTASLKKFEFLHQFSKALRKHDHVCFEYQYVLDYDNTVQYLCIVKKIQ